MPTLEPPVPIKPAPWTTKCASYWLLLNLRKLPEGVYDPLEASSPEFADPQLAGEFKGGLGMIMVVRYEDTPTGPYDELLLIPGVFRVPTKPTPRKRITRIYVSQRETCYNGRHNWNIPKHLARFTFSSPAGTPGPLTLAVYAPDPSAKAPFFSATLTPFRWLPAIPLSTRFLPLSTTLAQPPVPAAAPLPAAGPGGRGGDGGSDAAAGANADTSADAPATDPALLCGTQHWRSMPINAYSPATRGMWVTVHAPGTGPCAAGSGGGSSSAAAGAGRPSGARPSEAETAEAVAEATRWWPVAARPWPVGVWMDGAKIEIPAPVEWKFVARIGNVWQRVAEANVVICEDQQVRTDA